MKNKNDKLIYHLLWMLIQYSSESYETTVENEVYITQGYNADAHSTDTLEKLGYIKILPLYGRTLIKKWPWTKKIKFVLTEKGKLAINYDCIFD